MTVKNILAKNKKGRLAGFARFSSTPKSETYTQWPQNIPRSHKTY
jgi:hypothetical protein